MSMRRSRWLVPAKVPMRRSAGSFNNFIVKSGGNDIHGLVFTTVSRWISRARILPEELERQGVTNTSSVARYQSFLPMRGGPIVGDKFWWFYGFRNLNSDNWAPGFNNTHTGLPEPLYAPRCGITPTKLSYHLNSNHTLTYSGQYNHKSLPNSGLGLCGFGVDVAH